MEKYINQYPVDHAANTLKDRQEKDRQDAFNQLVLDTAYVLGVLSVASLNLIGDTVPGAQEAFVYHASRMRNLAAQLDPDPLRYQANSEPVQP